MVSGKLNHGPGQVWALLLICGMLWRVVSKPTKAETAKEGFDFRYSFNCPTNVTVNEIFKCEIAMDTPIVVMTAMQLDSDTPSIFQFKERDYNKILFVEYLAYGTSLRQCEGLEAGAQSIRANDKVLSGITFFHTTPSVRVKLIVRRMHCPSVTTQLPQDNMCSNGKPPTYSYSRTLTIEAETYGAIKLSPEWPVLMDDWVIVDPLDSILCRNRFEIAVRIDVESKRDTQLYGMSDTEGQRLVVAVLQPYIWDLRPPLKRLETSINVVAAAATVSALNVSAATAGRIDKQFEIVQNLGPIPGFTFSFLGSEDHKLQFAIEAGDDLFNGHVELNGTNFQGIFQQECQQLEGPCLVSINRPIRTGKHEVCVKALTRRHLFAYDCQSAEMYASQGELECYVDGEGAPLNGHTVLRTRPITGDYDPRLQYVLDFGDGSSPVTGTGLDENALFSHVYNTEGIFTASMKFSNKQQMNCEVAVANPIDSLEVIYPSGMVAAVGKSINVTLRVVSAGPFSIQVDDALLSDNRGQDSWHVVDVSSEGLFTSQVTASNIGFSKSAQLQYQGQVDDLQIDVEMHQDFLKTSSNMVGTVQFLEYTGQSVVPVGFRLNVTCIAYKDKSQVTQILYLNEHDRTFTFHLPILGFFNCTTRGMNDVTVTNASQQHLVMVADPLLLGGLDVFVENDGYTSTGCGKQYDVFDVQTPIKIVAKTLIGNATESVLFINKVDDRYWKFWRRGLATEYTVNSALEVGDYLVFYTAIGSAGQSALARRFLRMVESEEMSTLCTRYPPQITSVPSLKRPFPELRPDRLLFNVVNEPGTFHYIWWLSQSVCLSPRVLPNPQLEDEENEEIEPVYMNLTMPTQMRSMDVYAKNGDICIPQQELQLNELYKATIYVQNWFLVGRETHFILLGEELNAKLSTRFVRPLSITETLTVQFPEDLILIGLCQGSDCSRWDFHWEVETVYANESQHLLSDEEMARFTEGRNSFTLIISQDLLDNLEDQSKLLICFALANFYPKGPKSCVYVEIWASLKCDNCVLEAPSILIPTQRIRAFCSCALNSGKYELYVKASDGERTVSVEDKPDFNPLLPWSEEGLQVCIRSLSKFKVYINMCFETLKMKPMTGDELSGQLHDIANGNNTFLDDATASGDTNAILQSVHVISSQITTQMHSNLDSAESITAQRNQTAKLQDKLVTALGNIPLTDYASLLQVTSGIAAITTNSKDIVHATIDKIQFLLAQIVHRLPSILAVSSRDKILLLSQNLLTVSQQLLESMSNQYRDPTPFLRDRPLQSLSFDNDINSASLNSMDQLIMMNLQNDQRKTAASMVATLGDLNSALAFGLQEMLPPGGTGLQVTSNTVGTICFTRGGARVPNFGAIFCGQNRTLIRNLDEFLSDPDVVIQTNSLKQNFYDYFNDDKYYPQSDLISLTFYVNGSSVDVSSLNASFVFRLSKSETLFNISNADSGLDEEYLALPEVAFAVDGSPVYQPLIILSIDIEMPKSTLVFSLRPTDFIACPQYLMIARFIIHPNLQSTDEYGSFIWAMIPSSTSKCKPNMTVEEAMQLYAHYIDGETLADLKAEALVRTTHRRLKDEELRTLHIGYRQLNAIELNRYDKENPPPVPYPYTDQINNTAYVSVFMPSCYHISPHQNEWQTNGCKVLPSWKPDEVTCECNHVTTFGAATQPVSHRADLHYIIDPPTNAHFFSIAHSVDISFLILACTLMWNVTRSLYELSKKLEINSLSLGVCLIAAREDIGRVSR